MIILDLGSGDYFGLSLEEARALAYWVRGWPLVGAEVRVSKALPKLVESGLLTRDRSLGRADACPVSAPPPLESLADVESVVTERVGWRHVCAFLISVALVSVLLRLVSLRRIIAYVRRRKHSHAAAVFDLERARRLLGVFSYLHPWFLGRNDKCLRTSLMQLEFLARFDLFPDLVFGVRADPFSAHCWLQHQHVVINDSIRTTACLTPILVV